MEKILKYESRFAINKYKGSQNESRGFIYKKGVLPVLISVPNSVCQFREGKMKYPEAYTGALGMLLYELTGAHVVAKTSTDDDDPNYKKDSPYCDKLVDVVNKENIQLVIEIHGAGRGHPFAIDIGTNEHKTVRRETVDLFKEIFESDSTIVDRVTENLIYGATDKNNVINKIHTQTGVDSIQLEINQKYRNPILDLKLFNAIIENLVIFVRQMNLVIKEESCLKV